MGLTILRDSQTGAARRRKEVEVDSPPGPVSVTDSSYYSSCSTAVEYGERLCSEVTDVHDEMKMMTSVPREPVRLNRINAGFLLGKWLHRRSPQPQSSREW